MATLSKNKNGGDINFLYDFVMMSKTVNHTTVVMHFRNCHFFVFTYTNNLHIVAYTVHRKINAMSNIK